MRKMRYIVLGVAALCAVSCGVSQVPIDDAYYCAGDDFKTTPAQTQSAAAPAPTNTPTITYTNVQDTTVTIQVKR